MPFPARDLLNEKYYFGKDKTFGKNERVKDHGKSSTIMVSRGCPYSCSFCASPSIHKRKVRFRSLEKVREELEQLVNLYGVRQFRWQDDNIPLNFHMQKGLEGLLHGSGVISRGSARTDAVLNSTPILKKLYYAGFRELGFGIESADQKVLDLLGKKTSIGVNREALRLAKSEGFITRAFIMTGLPGEDIHSAERMINFFESLGKDKPDVVTLTTFMPLPGCDIFSNPEKYGIKILTQNWNDYNIAISRDGTPNWTHRHNNLTHDQMNQNLEILKEYLFTNGMSNVKEYNVPYKSSLLKS